MAPLVGMSYVIEMLVKDQIECNMGFPLVMILGCFHLQIDTSLASFIIAFTVSLM